MLAVARIALNLRPLVAALCLAKMVSMTLLLGYSFTRLGWVLTFRLEVIHVETQDVAIFDGMGDGVLMQATLE